jgi:hypothetical protein
MKCGFMSFYFIKVVLSYSFCYLFCFLALILFLREGKITSWTADFNKMACDI